MAERKEKFFVVSGPSGAGKTSIVTEALNRLQKEHDITRIVTYTSRPPREGEVDGKDYMFILGDDFKQKIQDGFFLETTEYSKHLYGSPLPPQQEMELGKSFVLIVEIEGAKKAVKEKGDGLAIWIDPPSMEVLKSRLLKRGDETVQQVERRVARAEEEIKEAHKIKTFDYFLVNEDFEQAVGEFIMLIKKVM